MDEFQFLHVDSVHLDVYIVEEEYSFIYHRRIVTKQWISSGESLYRGKSMIVSLNRPRGSPVHIYSVNPVFLSHIYYRWKNNETFVTSSKDRIVWEFFWIFQSFFVNIFFLQFLGFSFRERIFIVKLLYMDVICINHLGGIWKKFIARHHGCILRIFEWRKLSSSCVFLVCWIRHISHPRRCLTHCHIWFSLVILIVFCFLIGGFDMQYRIFFFVTWAVVGIVLFLISLMHKRELIYLDVFALQMRFA